MKKNVLRSFITVCLMTVFQCSVFSQDDFITIWDLSQPGSVSDNNDVIRFWKSNPNGPITYTWEEIGGGGATGSGSFPAGTNNFVDIWSGIPVNGTIRLSINPTNLERFYINNLPNAVNKLMDVEQWGTANWTSMSQAFWGCANLNITATDLPDLSAVSEYYYMFAGCSSLTGPANIGNWNMSNAFDFTSMFRGSTLFNQDISNWSTSNVVGFAWMFENASSFNQPIGSWNTSSAVAMIEMFKDANSFNQDLGTWNVSSVTAMTGMFKNAAVFNQPIGNWNTSVVNDLSEFFQGATAFNQDISNWNTSNVISFSKMFEGATAFNQDISNWNTSNTIIFASMFQGATSFNQNLGNWSLQGVSAWNYPMAEMLDNSGLDCDNYSATLIGWANNNPTTTNMELGAFGLTYGTNAVAARNTLVNDRGWDIGGDIAGTVPCVLPCSNNTGVDIIASCQPLVWMDGNTYAASNNSATFTLTNAGGCDSIVSLNFTLLTTVLTGVDYQEWCTPITWIDGNTYSASNNTATYTLTNSLGCDSIVTLDFYLITPINVTTSGETLVANVEASSYQWLDCDNGNAPIAGATDWTFIPTQSGNYAVEYVMESCTLTTSCATYTLSSIDSHYAQQWTLFPNPASEMFVLGNLPADGSIKITDVTGKSIFSEMITADYLTISTQRWNNGVYFVQVLNDNVVLSTKKLVVNK